jgi:hypothetical protein
MDSKENFMPSPNPTPSEYLKKYAELKNGIITLEEWQDFSKNILLNASKKINSHLFKK